MKLMHNILLIIFLCFFGTNVSAEIKTDDQKEAFNTAYTEYLKLTSENNYEAALPHAKILYELAPNLYEKGDKNIATVTYNYGYSLLKTGEQEEAKLILKETIDLYEDLYGKESIELVAPLMDLGHTYAGIFDGHSQSSFYRTHYQNKFYYRALEIVKKYKGEDDLLYAELSLDAGIKLLYLSQSNRGLKFLEKAYDIYAKKLGKDHYRTGTAAFHLGKFYLARGNYNKAGEYLNQALTTFEIPNKPSNALELSTHAYLVEVYERQGESDKATEHCQAIGRMTPWKTEQEQAPIFQKPFTNFPKSAARKRAESEITISLTINTAGTVSNPSVHTSSGNKILDQYVIESIKKWRFAPRFEDGQPVDTKDVLHTFVFKPAN